MKRVTTTALGLAALVAMLVLGVFSAGSASAYLFLWTGPLPALILILNDNNQIFQPVPGAGAFTVTCRHFRGHGIASNGIWMNATEITISGVYSKCEATGGLNVNITPVEYLIGANGLVGIVGKPIVLTIPGAGCSLKINNGGANASLFLLLYLNQPSGDILVHAEVGGIHSKGSGGACGEAGVENTEGTYVGLFLVSIHGGTIKWDLGV